MAALRILGVETRVSPSLQGQAVQYLGSPRSSDPFSDPTGRACYLGSGTYQDTRRRTLLSVDLEVHGIRTAVATDTPEPP
jgi:hypothetical protein